MKPEGSYPGSTEQATENMRPIRVFISHASSDSALVQREILTLLRSHDIAFWYSPDDIRTGDQWEKRIRDGLEACDWFLVVMTSNSAASEWVAREVHWAIENRQGRIIPVLLESCDLNSWHLALRTLQHVDFRQGATEARTQLLVQWSKAPSADASVNSQRLDRPEQVGQSKPATSVALSSRLPSKRAKFFLILAGLLVLIVGVLAMVFFVVPNGNGSATHLRPQADHLKTCELFNRMVQRPPAPTILPRDDLLCCPPPDGPDSTETCTLLVENNTGRPLRILYYPRESDWSDKQYVGWKVLIVCESKKDFPLFRGGCNYLVIDIGDGERTEYVDIGWRNFEWGGDRKLLIKKELLDRADFYDVVRVVDVVRVPTNPKEGKK